jgi:small-conductance mechanosensitive channel
VETVRQVEGVLPDRPVDSLYIEMGDTAMIFRVRWWIESYEDTRRMFDRVNTALQGVFDAHGIETPYPIHTMNLQVDKKTAATLSEAFREESKGRGRE